MTKRAPSLFGKNLYCLLVFLPVVCSAQSRSAGPCDILGSNATPCVAAFSTTRALQSSYNGPLYQVTRQSDGNSANVGVLSNGVADATSQDNFCGGTTCTITKVYDQTSNHNDLTPAPPGGNASGPGPGGYDLPAVANALPVIVGGYKAYGISITPGMGYRNDSTTGIATNGQPEGVYMVSSTLQVNPYCCFDFGNAETNNLDTGSGHMDAINIICGGSPCIPFPTLDLENGIFGGPSGMPIPMALQFSTIMGWNDGQNNYDVYWGNAQYGFLKSTGAVPLSSGYSPMHQEGAIVLGVGGDNSNAAVGYFFEGVMTAGTPSDATMNSLQSNIVAAGYWPSSSTSLTTGIYDDYDSRIYYSPNAWIRYPAAGAYQGNRNVNDSPNAYAVLSFVGTTLDLYGPTSPAYGQADVYVDNSFIQTIDLYSSSSVENVHMFSTGTLASGTHTVVLVNRYQHNPSSSGYWTGLDRVVVNGSSTAVLPADGIYTFVAESSGKVLDVTGGPTALQDGVRVEQWDSNGGTNQQWQILQLSDGSYEVNPVSSSRCLDVNAGSTDDGAVVQQYQCGVPNPNQRWYFSLLSDGSYQITAQHSGKCLDVTGGPTATSDGIPIEQWSCNGGTNQRWYLQLP